MEAGVRTRVKACACPEVPLWTFTSNSVTSKSMEGSSSTSREGYPGTWASQDYILVCVDAFSGIVWLFSLREATSAKPQ